MQSGSQFMEHFCGAYYSSIALTRVTNQLRRRVPADPNNYKLVVFIQSEQSLHEAQCPD